MSQSQTFNNTAYQIPVQGDTKWGPPLTRYLAALGTYAISPAGGLYTLTADLNLGASFGLLTAYYKSASSNIASTGLLRLAQSDTVSWRNVANSADLALAVNGSNQLTFNGSTLNTLAIPVTVPNGGTGLTSTAVNGVLTGGATTTGAFQNVGTGSINQVLTSAGAGLAPVWSAIGTGTVNTGTQYQLAYYAASSNIVSGLTLLTASSALASDANGLPVASTTTAAELGFVHGVTSAIQTQITAVATTANGALQTTGGTMSGAIAMGTNNITGIALGQALGLRATGTNTGASGASTEILYSAGGTIQAFDRTGLSFQPMTVSGSTVSLTSGSGTTYLSATTAGASLLGTNTNNNASAGNVGQYIESVIAATNMPATGVYGDLTSISLTAGDWDVSFVAVASRNTATLAQFTDARIGISQTTGNSTTGLTFGSNFIEFSEGTTGIDNMPMQIANYRQSLSGTTTIYAKMQGSYTAGQPQMTGRLSARRIR